MKRRHALLLLLAATRINARGSTPTRRRLRPSTSSAHVKSQLNPLETAPYRFHLLSLPCRAFALHERHGDELLGAQLAQSIDRRFHSLQLPTERVDALLDEMEAAARDEAQTSTLSEMQYVAEAAEQLIECRRVLKYSYIHGFYARKSPQKELFEYVQADLDRVTEKLSGMLEQETPPGRIEMVNATADARKRLRNFMEDTATDFASAFEAARVQSEQAGAQATALAAAPVDVDERLDEGQSADMQQAIANSLNVRSMV